MSSTRKVGNANVSGGALSAAERRDISMLFVKFEKRTHGNADSQVWLSFGDLAVRSETDSEAVTVIDKNRRYCQLCLKREQDLYAGKKRGSSGHISRIKTYSKVTAILVKTA
jgi:hypothetical protein